MPERGTFENRGVKHKVPVDVEVTDYDLYCILESACGGAGCHYWADLINNQPEDPTDGLDNILYRFILDDMPLYIHDMGEQRWTLMTRSMLLRGIGKYIVDGGTRGFAAIDDVDGPAADAMIQFAIFGEQVYG